MSAQDLLEALEAHLDGEATHWLQEAGKLSGERLLAAFVGAGRRLGSGPFDAVSGDERLQSEGWSLRRAGRVYLLWTLDAREGSAAQDWIERAYREGDSREKAAVISALPVLSGGSSLKTLALDAGRTNEAGLFASVALHNPYPAEHYSDHEFNQLVMKAAFQDLELGGISGLQERANADLARMGMAYIDERLSAQRSFPSSLWLAIAPGNPPGALARMLGELQHSQASRREGAAMGLALTKDMRALGFLEERLAMESTEASEAVLRKSILALQENPS